MSVCGRLRDVFIVKFIVNCDISIEFRFNDVSGVFIDFLFWLILVIEDKFLKMSFFRDIRLLWVLFLVLVLVE